jgi:hypothetical protein
MKNYIQLQIFIKTTNPYIFIPKTTLINTLSYYISMLYLFVVDVVDIFA